MPGTTLTPPENFRLLMKNQEEAQNFIMRGLEARREELIDAVADIFYAQMARAVTGPLSDVARQSALTSFRSEARIKAGNLITGMIETELESIAKTITQGLDDGVGPRAIARRLEQVTGLDSNRQATFLKQREYLESIFPDTPAGRAALKDREDALYKKLLRDRRKTIAQTEARFATATAREEAAKARGARFKIWLTVGDSRVSDMDQANEAEGAIPIDANFSSGHGKPPSHPNCRCTLAYATSEAQRDRMQERQIERAKQTAAAKDQADAIENAA